MNAKYAAKLGILMTGLGAGTVCGQDLQPGRLGDAAGPEVFIDMSVRRRLPDCTRFIHEPSEAAAQRAESYEAGRYYPPEDVAQTLRELLRAKRAGAGGPCAATILARLERAEARTGQTLSESLDKDSFVINGNLELFEKRFTALEKRVAAAGRNGLTEDARRALATEYVRYFQGDGGELLQMYVALYRGAMKTVEDKTPFGSRWLDEGVNPAARTLSRLGPRVGRLESVLGLDAPTTPPPAPGRNIPAEVLGLSFASAAGAVPGLRDDEPQDDVHPAALYKPVISASMAKVRPVPAPSEPVQGQEKRFSEFSLMEGVMAGPGWSEELSDRVRAGVNHLFGLTRTVGDPDGRAGLVHHQTGGTCMVVSQQQVLVQAGLLPPGDATAIERALAKQANDRGDAVRNGVAWRDSGKLLVERGVPVVSHARASDERLLAAAASGRMLIAGVDAGKFWRDPRHDGGGHAIVVTGAEVDKNGKVVGLFVNDSGTGDARRYVTTELFLAAFDKDGRYFLEIL